MRRFLLTLLGLGLLTGPAQAQTICQPVDQFFAPAAYDQLLHQPLVVVLPAEPQDPKQLRQEAGKTPDELASYRADLVAVTAFLRAAGKFWQGGTVTYVSAADARKLYDDPQQAHLLLSQRTLVFDRMGNGISYKAFIPALTLDWVGLVRSPAFSNGAPTRVGSYTVACEMLPSGIRGIHRHRITETYHASDFISAVQQMQHYVELRAQGQSEKQVEKTLEATLGQNGPQLKAKTLLLAREQLSENLPEKKLASAYPFPVQVADRAAVEAAVAAADPRYLYVRRIIMEHDNGYQLLDAATGTLLSYAEYRMMHLNDLDHLQASNLRDIYQRAVADSQVKN